MFGKKKAPRKSGPEIALLREDNGELLICPLRDYALPEAAVLRMSMEYFSDPEPCAIHRGAVHKRAMLELRDCCAPGEMLSVRALPMSLRDCFPDDCAFVQIRE